MTGTEFRTLQQTVIDWLRTCESSDGSGFVMSHEASQPTLMALSFAVLILELFDLLPDPRSDQWVERFQSAQDSATALFVDPLLEPGDLKETGPGFDYLVYQTTYFSVAALDALGQRLHHTLTFAVDLAREEEMTDWMEALDWSQPWATSNWVMFLATALYAEWQWYGAKISLDGLHAALDWLDSHQDPETDYWGVGRGTPLSHAMTATYHFLPYYFCLGRKVHHVNQMIDSTLALQEEDGLFHPEGSGDTCRDVDAVDILVKCSLRSSYRDADVQTALDRAYVGLLDNQAPDGAFCRARHRPLPARSLRHKVSETLGLDRLLGKHMLPSTVWHHSGWRAMPFDIRQGDLWSTWFRPFGLALINARCSDKYPGAERWRFRNLPALGWHDLGKGV